MSVRTAWWFLHISGVLFVLNAICLVADLLNSQWITAVANALVGVVNLQDAVHMQRIVDEYGRRDGSR